MRGRQARRSGFEDSAYPQAAYVRAAHAAAAAIDAREFVAQGLAGEAIGEAVRKARGVAIAKVREQFGDAAQDS